MTKINNRNTEKRCEIFSKLTVKTREGYHCRLSGVSIVKFEDISELFLVSLMLGFNR